MQFFRVQSVLKPCVTIFNSSGGTACLVISIGITPRFVSCQPHLKESSTYSPFHSCIWWYIQSTCWFTASEVDPQASNLTECQVCPNILSWNLCTRSSSRVLSLLPPSRRSRIFSPACNMSFLPDTNEKILNRSRNSSFFKNFWNTARDPTKCNLDVVLQPQKVCIARFECVSSSPSNCLDFLISTAVFSGIGIEVHGVVKLRIVVPQKKN